MRYVLICASAIAALAVNPAIAGCSTYMGTGHCETNQFGQRIITQKNYSGGYTSNNVETRQRSYTSPNMGGGWTTTTPGVGSVNRNYDPYPNMGNPTTPSWGGWSDGR